MSDKIPIDWKQVGEWLTKGAKGVDIAERLGIHPNTLYNRCYEELNCGFCEFSAQKKAVMKMRILELQLELAEAKNMQMLIWLGKQYCGQREPEPKTSFVSLSGAQLYWNDQEKNYLENKNANAPKNELQTTDKSD